MRSGFYRTAAGDLSAELLKRNATGLKRYLAMRLRDYKLAAQAFEMLREALDSGHKDDLKRPPGPRSHLYRLARNIVAFYKCVDVEIENRSIAHAPWDDVPRDRIEGYARGIDAARTSVNEDELELVELQCVHGLNHDEIAYVVELSSKRIATRIASTTTFVRMLVEDETRGQALPKDEIILEDLFRLLPPPVGVSETTEAKDPPKLSAGTILGERYEIEACVGGGAFAHVYRARDVKVHSHVVALKVLHRAANTPTARDGALAELSLLASAFHPSLVHFKDHGWHQDRLWFVMPWYQGQTLQTRLEQSALSMAEVRSIFVPISRAIAALHNAGIRHQDIKPENIFLAELKSGTTTTTHPVLLDLGAASQTGDMLVAGTPMYFAPEMAKRFSDADSEEPITNKADVFALALSLLHAIEPPDANAIGESDLDAFVKERAANAPAGPKRDEHAKLHSLFERALSKDPTARPTADEFADALENLEGINRRRKPISVKWNSIGKMGGIVVALAIAILGVRLAWRDAMNNLAKTNNAPTENVEALRHRLDESETRARALEDALEASRAARVLHAQRQAE